MPSDTELRDAVQAELKWEPRICAAHIGVAADEGVVTLAGHVDNYGDKYAAEQAVRRVKGVRGIVEELEVRLPFDTVRDDGQIAAAAIDRLMWNSALPRDAITVKVEHGWVTLTGEVDWRYQFDEAQHDIRPLHGVVGVSNLIKIKPRVDVAHLSDDITKAFERSCSADAKSIRVSVEDGLVRLTGTAHSLHDRYTAGRTAWSARGVTAVDNAITIIV